MAPSRNTSRRELHAAAQRVAHSSPSSFVVAFQFLHEGVIAARTGILVVLFLFLSLRTQINETVLAEHFTVTC